MLGTRAGQNGQAESPGSRLGQDVSSKVEIRWPLVFEILVLFCLNDWQNFVSSRQGIGFLVGFAVELCGLLRYLEWCGHHLDDLIAKTVKRHLVTKLWVDLWSKGCYIHSYLCEESRRIKFWFREIL